MSTKFKLISVLIALVVVCLWAYNSLWSGNTNKPSTTPPDPQTQQLAGSPSVKAAQTSEFYPVTEVIDGDTIKVNTDGEIQTIRLIGVDAPETNPPECYSRESTAYVKQLLSGISVSLESDPTQSDKDKYGRLLRYIFLRDGTNFNKDLISSGYAREYTYDKPYKYQEEFKQAELEAKSGKLGLWGESCACTKDGESSRTCSACKQATVTYTNWDCSTYTKSIGDASCTAQCPKAPTPAPKPAPVPTPSYTCDCSKTCNQMVSCDEAYYQLNSCGCSKRDGDGDGVPCESICPGG